MARFRDLRVKSGYSQEEFRKLYNEKYNRNYTSAAISMIEHGKRMPELGALMDFADFYGVSLDYLLSKSFFIGDMVSDMLCAKKAGNKGIRYSCQRDMTTSMFIPILAIT